MSRSESLKLRHQRARQEFDFFKDRYNEDVKYSDFLKEDSPLKSKIIVYDVSYQVSYRGSAESLLITPTTFRVIGFKGQETEIQKRTMNMVLDSKGRVSKNNLSPNTLNMLDNELRNGIQVLPRGMEESTARVNKEDVEKLYSSGFVVRDLDTTIKIKNSKGREGKMDLDIRHFL